MKMLVLDKYILEQKESIDSEVAKVIDGREKEACEISEELGQIISAIKKISSGGKRLRGLLTILGYELAGGINRREIVKAAAAMEIFHLGLLIQDDFMDRDHIRRGVPTIYSQYEDKHVAGFVSMLAGDYTFGWVIEMLSGLDIDEKSKSKAIRVWGKYFTRVGYGQTLDGLGVANEKTILQILELKSGEYSCVLPLELGATLADADVNLIETIRKYGMELGWIFQLRDDWLAEYGETEKTGKPVGGDKREGKKSFVQIYGKEKTEEEIKNHLERAKLAVCEIKSDKRVLLEEIAEWMAARVN